MEGTYWRMYWSPIWWCMDNKAIGGDKLAHGPRVSSIWCCSSLFYRKKDDEAYDPLPDHRYRYTEHRCQWTPPPHSHKARNCHTAGEWRWKGLKHTLVITLKNDDFCDKMEGVGTGGGTSKPSLVLWLAEGRGAELVPSADAIISTSSFLSLSSGPTEISLLFLKKYNWIVWWDNSLFRSFVSLLYLRWKELKDHFQCL